MQANTLDKAENGEVELKLRLQARRLRQSVEAEGQVGFGVSELKSSIGEDLIRGKDRDPIFQISGD